MKQKKLLSGTGNLKNLKRFMELDKKVLRFYCVWRDGSQERKFVLHVSGKRERRMIEKSKMIERGGW